MREKAVVKARQAHRAFMRLSGTLQMRQEISESLKDLTAATTELDAKVLQIADRLEEVAESSGQSLTTAINNVHNIQIHQLNLLIEILGIVTATKDAQNSAARQNLDPARSEEKEGSIVADEINRLDGYIIHHVATLHEEIRALRSEVASLRTSPTQKPDTPHQDK